MPSACNTIPNGIRFIFRYSPNSSTELATAHKMLTVRVGCNIHFECESSATVILLVNPRFDPDRPIRKEKLDFRNATRSESFTDADGNVAYRVVLATGLNEIMHDALLELSTPSEKTSQLC